MVTLPRTRSLVALLATGALALSIARVDDAEPGAEDDARRG
jgi:hypothetical protein